MGQCKSYNISQKFFGKILLFGEYGIILNSKGLAVPFRALSGELAYYSSKNVIPSDIDKSQKILSSFGEYIVNDTPDLLVRFNHKVFEKDLEKGLYFNSNIPIGYGVGSSGALVAAIYHKYFEKRTSQHELKEDFAILESYFHGKSSGYDPLVSYLNKAILINEDKSFTNIDFDIQNSGISVFLVDSGIERKTKGFVQEFMQKLEDENYKKSFDQDYMFFTKKAIDSLVNNEKQKTLDSVEKISEYQLSNFIKLIPENIKDSFEYGLETKDFILKFCGAGGGGYFLGFTKNFSSAESFFKAKQIPILNL
jgi:mevalonate kinase